MKKLFKVTGSLLMFIISMVCLVFTATYVFGGRIAFLTALSKIPEDTFPFFAISLVILSFTTAYISLAYMFLYAFTDRVSDKEKLMRYQRWYENKYFAVANPNEVIERAIDEYLDSGGSIKG